MISIKKGDSVTFKWGIGIKCVTVVRGTTNMVHGYFYYRGNWGNLRASVQDIVNVYRPSEGWVIKNE